MWLGLSIAAEAQQLLVQNNTKERRIHVQSAVVFDEAQLSEPVHEEIHSCAGGTNHFRQHLLTYLWNDGFKRVFFSEAGQDQEGSCQTLFARIEQLIDQVRLRAVVPFDHVDDK